MDIDTASVIARESGFDVVGTLDTSKLDFRQDVRDMCTPELCPQGYGRSWSCPPSVPVLEDLRAEAGKYAEGIIVQTVGQMEDSFDFETIEDTTKKHAKAFLALADKLIAEQDGEVLCLGAGPCPRCVDCTYPENPCRYPDKIITSMEASGLLVNQVCEENGLLYNHGEKTIAFTSCCLF